MNKSTFRFFPNLLQFLIFFILFICYTTGIFVWPIRRVTPMYLLPLLIAFAMHRQETTAAFTGLALGIFMDSASSHSGIFHTVFFFFIGLASSFLIHYLLNCNIRSALLLALAGSLLYFLSRWLLFHAFSDSMAGSTAYLMQYALPGTIYTTVYIFPFYYLERLFNRFIQK